jgi:hypothetical protein
MSSDWKYWAVDNDSGRVGELAAHRPDLADNCLALYKRKDRIGKPAEGTIYTLVPLVWGTADRFGVESVYFAIAYLKLYPYFVDGIDPAELVAALVLAAWSSFSIESKQSRFAL